MSHEKKRVWKISSRVQDLFCCLLLAATRKHFLSLLLMFFSERIQRPFWCCVGLMANFDKQMSTWRRDPEKSEFLANKVTCPFCRGKKEKLLWKLLRFSRLQSVFLFGRGREKRCFLHKIGSRFYQAQDFLECHICCEDGCSMCSSLLHDVYFIW